MKGNYKDRHRSMPTSHYSMRPINASHNAKSNLSRRYPLLIAAALLLIVSCCAADSSIHGPELGDVPVFGYQIVNSYPHDPMAFTQGLVYDRDDV
ncbi:MAG: glutaminyl-peptide cyclotransferase, partial [Methanothrix sp.]|nr:glutaminyl-peptide cyclotransferase [Methanothrix sp.]